MKYIYTVLAFMILINCSSKTKKAESINEDKLSNMENIFYGVNCDIATPFKLFINDIMIFQFNEEGAIDFYKPINDLILKSGMQKISIELYPRKGKDFVNNSINDFFNLEVIASKDLNLTEFNKVLTCKLPSISQRKKIEMTWTFEAKVPYELKGWKNSIQLTDENQTTLLQELIQEFDFFKQLLSKKDYETFISKTRNRDLEIAKSLYLSKEDINMDDEDMINSIKNITKVYELEDFKIIFYANGKLVTLLKNNIENVGEPILQAELQDESVDLYDLIFHRPKKGAPLEVIR